MDYEEITTVNGASSGSIENDAGRGFHLGIRGGLSFSKKYFVGLEYLTGGPYDMEFGSSTASITKAEVKNGAFGILIGADFQQIRISATYFFDNEVEIEETSSGGFESENELDGSGVRIGFGLPVSKNLRANLDLMIHDVDDAVASNSVTRDYDVQTAMVSISIPWELKP